MRNWYAVYVRSRQEQKVFERLENNKISAFLPKWKVVKQYSDRKVVIEEVLFKSYVLVSIDILQTVQVLQIVGVVGFVKFEGKPVPIPEIQIEAIRRFILKGNQSLVSEDEFLLGQKIEILKGPFKGQQGRLVNISKREIVVIEIEVLNRFIPLQIHKSSLKKLK